MRFSIICFHLFLVILIKISENKNVSYRQHWRDIIFLEDLERSQCSNSENDCPKSMPYNSSHKVEKLSTKIINNSSAKEAIPTEKAIESFDEWTKKRRDAAANLKIVGNSNIDPTVIRRLDEVSISPISGPTRNFASKECGAKVIASNPEAENAKSVVEKDVDDYMRNPCQAAKEKFFVIELCEAIQIKKIAIGNFELFASRPKLISVQVSERYPPLANWISLGSFHLQDHHKILQEFDVPNTNSYVKYVKVNLEEHYGKEHYCIVSVVNVMGSTLTDEYEKEEEAINLLNTLSGNENKEEKKTTPAPAEEKMPTQLPTPPKADNRTVVKKKNGLILLQNFEICFKCPSKKVSFSICQLFPVKLKNAIKQDTISSNFKRVQHETTNIDENKLLHYTYKKLRRRNLASIQRQFSIWKNRKNKIKKETSNGIEKPKKLEENKVQTSNEMPSLNKEKHENELEKLKIEQNGENENEKVQKAEKSAKTTKHENIVPAGGSTNQREMVLMKLSKRIAAVEMNLTLSTEYLSELSKQYVTQMSGYQLEIKETRRILKDHVKSVEILMRNKLNRVQREMKKLKNSLILLEKYEMNRYKQEKYDMTRSIFVPSCHMTSPTLPPSPLGRLPEIGTIEKKISDNYLENDNWIEIVNRAKSIIFGSISWNTDHLIMALIISNFVVLTILFATFFYIQRRNHEMKAEIRNELQRKIGQIALSNKKMIAKGIRKAELAVTAAVTSSLKIDRSSKNTNVAMQFETALKNLFAAQQHKIDEQFEENKKIMRDVLLMNERRNSDHIKLEDSESSSETEQKEEIADESK